MEYLDIIDDFVDFLITEQCQGCTECEPRLPSKWKPGFACCIQGIAKDFMEQGKQYKAERGKKWMQEHLRGGKHG